MLDLTRSGISYADAMGLTLGQVRAYSQAAERARKRDHQATLVLARAAQHYGKEDLLKLVKTLES